MILKINPFDTKKARKITAMQYKTKTDTFQYVRAGQ